MSCFILDNLTTPWGADSTGLWSLIINPAPNDIGDDGFIMEITSHKGSEGGPTPYTRRLFNPPIDLSEIEELRFWFRSSRSGDGGQGTPFYLALEASNNPLDPALFWSRLLQVKRTETWEMQRMWLGDMPVGLREAVGVLQLRSLDPAIAFNAAIGSIVAVNVEPLQDVEQNLMGRLNNRFQISLANVLTYVPAIFDLPENPGQRTLPYILITPLSIKPYGDGTGETIDNYTIKGAFCRPSPKMYQIEYIITVFAEERLQKASLIEAIIKDFSRSPYLFNNLERLSITNYFPSPDEAVRLNLPGGTPLFYRLIIFMEIGSRVFRSLAVPYLKTAPISGRETEELMKI